MTELIKERIDELLKDCKKSKAHQEHENHDALLRSLYMAERQAEYPKKEKPPKPPRRLRKKKKKSGR